MGIVFKNNAKTTLSSNISNSATSIAVTDGSVFPSLNAGEFFLCTFDDGSNNEIVKCTARSSNTLTVIRAQESTTARAFSAADACEGRVTAGVLETIQENIAAKSANQTVYNATTASSATAYNVGTDPQEEANAMVFLNGVMQHHDTFSFSGSTLTFDAAPSDGLKLEVIIDNLINLQSSNLTVDSFTATSGQTAFTLTDVPAAEDNLLVFIEGVFQNQDAYSFSGTTLTMSAGVTLNRKVVVYIINPVNIGTPSDGTVTSAKLSGNITTPGNLTVGAYDVAFDSPTFVVDNANSRVGIGTATPSMLLDITGDTQHTGHILIKSQNELRFYEAANYVGFEAPALSANQIWVLPAADGSASQLLKTDGSGNLGWATDSALTLANNTNNYVVTATGSGLNGEGNLTFDGSTLAVTGAITASGAITGSAASTITTADNLAQLTLVSTDTDANQGPILNLNRNPNEAGTDNDYLGQIYFTGHNDAGTPEDIIYSKLTSQILDASDGTEDANVVLYVMKAGARKDMLRLGPSEIVVNEGSEDIDFRVESDGNTHMLFVDGGANHVGIGTATPGRSLTIKSNTNHLYLEQSNADNGWVIETADADGYLHFQRRGEGGSPSDTERVTITTDGNVGIGNSTPGSYYSNTNQLVVGSGAARQGITIASSTSTIGQLAFADGTSGDARYEGSIVYNHSDNHMELITNHAVAMYIDSAQKVLIGDTASHTSDLLQIETPASGGGHGIQIRRNDANTDQGIGHILFGNNTATDLVKISAKTDGDSNSGDSGALMFSTQVTGGNLTERMRISSSGNISLACASDYKTLTVGDSDAEAWITAGGTNTHLTLSPVGTSGAIIFKTNSTNGDPSDATERVRITPAGQIGLGGTNYGSSGQVLTSNASGAVSWETASGGVSFKQEGTNFTTSLLVGHSTTGSLTGALNCTGVGITALDALTSADNCTAVGALAGTSINSGHNCTVVGAYALKNNASGQANTAMGYGALMENTASNNTAFGSGAGQQTIGGAGNTYIGALCGDLGTTAVENTLLGYNVDTTYNNSSNVIKIGNNFTGHEANSKVSIGNDSGYIWAPFTTSGTWTVVSDRRLKKNIEDDDLGLAFINELKPVTFNWKSNEEIDPEFLESKTHKGDKKDTEITMHGFIAQDVKAAMDKVGNTTFNGWWDDTGDGQGISRSMFITPLVKAIQELSAEVEQLKQQAHEKCDKS